MGRIRSCGFLRIFTYTVHVFFLLRVREYPAGLELPADARNGNKHLDVLGYENTRNFGFYP